MAIPTFAISPDACSQQDPDVIVAGGDARYGAEPTDGVSGVLFA
jgi:hypothetical protein